MLSSVLFKYLFVVLVVSAHGFLFAFACVLVLPACLFCLPCLFCGVCMVVVSAGGEWCGWLEVDYVSEPVADAESDGCGKSDEDCSDDDAVLFGGSG